VLLAAIGVLVLGATSLAGCPAAHDDYPTLACKIDSDCFKGETCVALVCTPVQDLAVQPDLLLSQFDFMKPPDLEGVDGGGDDL
jgi:hypothetical protein